MTGGDWTERGSGWEKQHEGLTLWASFHHPKQRWWAGVRGYPPIIWCDSEQSAKAAAEEKARRIAALYAARRKRS